MHSFPLKSAATTLALTAIVVVGVTSLYRMAHRFQHELGISGVSGEKTTVTTDLFVYGAGLGGASAAITSAREGVASVLVSETATIGGMATETGLSAFDDVSKQWEKYGLFLELQQFLKNKYPNTSGSFGLGKAKVGAVATLPSDIESFFTETIGKEKNIALYKEFTLHGFLSNIDGMSGALLVSNKNASDTLLVKFRYAIDGTPTGKAIEKSATPYVAGFDAKESTREPSALPQKVLDAFKNGYKIQDTRRDGHGNLTQATGIPMALIDKGYSGFFYGIQNSPCLEESPVKPFLKNGTVFKAKEVECIASISVRPDFQGIYDVYVIRGASDGIDAAVSGIIAGADISMAIEKQKDEYMDAIGTFSFERGKEYSVRLGLSSKDSVEGILLRSKNIPVTAVSKQASNVAKVTFDVKELTSLLGDIYIHAPNRENKEMLAVSIDGVKREALSAGKDLWKVRDVNAKAGLAFSFDAPLQEIGLTFVPTRHKEPPTLSLRESNAIRKRASIELKYFDNKAGILEWTFTPAQAGRYAFFLEGPQGNWSSFELYDIDAKRQLELSGGQSPSRIRSGGMPVWSGDLKKNAHRILFASSDAQALAGSKIIIQRIEEANMAFSGVPTEVIYENKRQPRMHDIWVKTNKDVSMIISATHEAGNMDIAYVKNMLGYTYVGKYFLDTNERIRLRSERGGIVSAVAIPDLETLVYAYPLQGRSHTINLHPGEWTAALSKEADVPNIAFSGKKIASDERKRTFAFTSKAAQSLSWTTNESAKGMLFFHERIPAYTQEEMRTWNVFLPLFKTTNQKNMTMFEYRNIVSPESIWSLDVGLPEATSVSRLSQGVTVFLNSFTDYTPVDVRLIDDASLRGQSVEQAYKYYYWLKYIAPETEEYLGCKPSLHCTPERIQPALNVYDTEDGYPESIYIREARRMQSIRMLTESDIAATYRNCKKDGCDENVCYQYQKGQAHCLASTQKAVVFGDALAAAQYQIDFHRFLPIESDGYINQFLREMKILHPEENLEETVFRRFRKSLPVEITASSLIPKNRGNVYPGSTNFGVTQIANAALRVHTVEMQVGASIGYLLSYAIQNDITPYDAATNPTLLRSFQRSLVRKGVHLYPINLINDWTVMRGVQYLILDGLVTPEVVIETNAFSYVVPNGNIDANDEPILRKIASRDAMHPPTYRNVLSAIMGEGLSDGDLYLEAIKKNLPLPRKDQGVLDDIVGKYDLYKLYALYQEQAL